MSELTHLDGEGSARMVDIGGKAVSERRARARAAARCVSGGSSSFRATIAPEPAPRPGPGQVLAPICHSRSTGVVCPGLLPNGRQRKF